MSGNPLLDQFFKPKKAEPVQNPLDETFKTLGVKGGLKQVQKGNQKDESLRPRGHGEARRVAKAKLPNLDPETSTLLESALYMNSRDVKGNTPGPNTPAANIRNYSVDPKTRDSIINEFKSDPEVAKAKYGAQRQAFRDVRTRSLGGAKNPGLISKNPDPTAGTVVPKEDELSQFDPNHDRFAKSGVDSRPMHERLDESAKAFVKVGEDIGGALAKNIPLTPFQEANENIGKFLGGTAAAIATTPATALSAIDYSADTTKPAFARTMSFVNALVQAEGLAGSPVLGPILHRALKGGWRGVKALVNHISPQELEGVAKATGQSVETIQKGAQGAKEAIATVPDEVGNEMLSNPVIPDNSPTASTTAEPSTSPVPETPIVQTETPAGSPKTLEGSPTPPLSVETSVPLTQPKVTRTVQDINAEIEAVRARMDQRAKPLPGGKRAGAATKLGPDDIKDAVTLGRLHFEKGLRSFEDWSREMVKAFGTAVRQHLPEIWKQVSGPVTGDSVDRLQKILGEATVLRSDFAENLSAKARSQKIGKLAGAQASSVGKPFGEAMSKQMGSQKGSFANYSFELPSPIDAEDLAHLKDMVLTHPQLRPGDKLNAQLALEKIAGDGQYGGLPTPGEISALEKVFGKGIGTKLRTMQAPSIWEEVVMFRKAGLLSGPRTVLRNFIGNATNAFRSEALRPFDALSDQLVRLAFPKATEGRRTVAAGLGWSADRSVNVAQKTAQDVKDVLKYGQDWGGSVEVAKESRNPIVKYALRFQGVQDSIWMNAAYERSLFEQASLMKKKNPALDLQSLLDNPTEAMHVQAQFDSQVSTFNAPNKLAESIQSLTKVPGIGPVIEFLVPFKRVPSNIGSEMAQANPVGALVNWCRALNEAKQTGSLSYATQRQLAKQTTNGALGTGLLWLGVELARQGKMTGSAPVDPAQKTTNEALNVRPASLQIGDSRFQMTGTHPFLSVMALGASAYESAQRRHDQAVAQSDRLKGKGLKPEDFGVSSEAPRIDPLKDAGSWAVAFGSIMQEQSFLKGIKDFVDSAQSERQVQSFVNNAVSSFAPVIVNDVQRMAGKGDDVVRDPSNIGEAFRARLGFGKDIPAKRDAFGREIKLGGVFDVTNAKEVKADPVSLLMKNNGLTVTKLQRLPKEPAAHYQERQMLYGQFLYHVLNNAEPQLSQIADKKVLKEVWDKLTDAVRSKLEGGLNIEVLRKLNGQQSEKAPAGG